MVKVDRGFGWLGSGSLVEGRGLVMVNGVRVLTVAGAIGIVKSMYTGG